MPPRARRLAKRALRPPQPPPPPTPLSQHHLVPPTLARQKRSLPPTRILRTTPLGSRCGIISVSNLRLSSSLSFPPRLHSPPPHHRPHSINRRTSILYICSHLLPTVSPQYHHHFLARSEPPFVSPTGNIRLGNFFCISVVLLPGSSVSSCCLLQPSFRRRFSMKHMLDLGLLAAAALSAAPLIPPAA